MTEIQKLKKLVVLIDGNDDTYEVIAESDVILTVKDKLNRVYNIPRVYFMSYENYKKKNKHRK